MRYLKGFVLAAAFAVTLSACGSSTSGAEAPATPNSAGGTAAAAPTAGAVDANALCDFLRSEIARLQPVGSEVGRLAQLTVHLYTWTEEQKIQEKFDVDQLTQQACPDVGAEVLKLIGTDSFANAF